MAVPFQELGGSPVEIYDPDGFRAQREFLIAWDDRDAFALELLGTATTHAASAASYYPGKTSVFAMNVRYEPFDPKDPDCKPLASLTQGLNSYSQSFAKAIVQYRTLSPQDRSDGPPSEPGTHLTYRMTWDVETCQLASSGWTWLDQPAVAAPGDVPLFKVIPVTDHHLTWHQVIGPPWDAIRDLQGKVNSAAFLGCPTGTVLFLGAEANKLYRGGFDAGASDFCWELHYVFRERAVKQGSAVFGWNHFYRPSPPGWAELASGGQPMYDLADLSRLFQSTA